MGCSSGCNNMGIRPFDECPANTPHKFIWKGDANAFSAAPGTLTSGAAGSCAGSSTSSGNSGTESHGSNGTTVTTSGGPGGSGTNTTGNTVVPGVANLAWRAAAPAATGLLAALFVA